MSDHLADVDTERSVVAAIVIQPDAIAEVADWLPADAFTDPKLRAVYRAALRLWEKRIPATHVTVPPELIAMGGKSLTEATDFVLGLAASAVTSVYVAHDAEVVLRFARLRAIDESAKQLIVRCCELQPFDVDEALVGIRRAAAKFERPAMTASGVAEQMQAIRERAEQRRNGQHENVLPLRFTVADRILDGGLRDGQLMYLPARPSMGKSALMVHMASYRRAVIFSLEMPWMDVRNRMVCSLAAVPFAVGIRGIGTVEQCERWIDATYQVETWPVQVFDTARTTAQIEAECLRIQQEDGLDAVFIDHLGLLADEARRGGEYERVSMISRRLKELAMRLNVPVVCLAQLNRSVEDRPPYAPHLSDLRDSGRLEEDADVVALLYRRHYYAAKGMIAPDDSQDRILGTGWDRAQLFIEKNRNGETGVADLGWEARYMRFHDPETRLAS